MVDQHNVSSRCADDQLHGVLGPNVTGVVGGNVLSWWSELGMLSFEAVKFSRQPEELVGVCACNNAYEICQHVLNRTLESQRVGKAVGYTETNLSHALSSIPSPEKKLPLRLATERDQVLTWILW